MQQQRSLKEFCQRAPPDRETRADSTISSNGGSNKASGGGGVKRFLNRAFGTNYSKKILNNADKGLSGSNSKISQTRSEEDIKSASYTPLHISHMKGPKSSIPELSKKSEINPSKKVADSHESIKFDGNDRDKEETSEVPVSVAAVVAALESFQKTQHLDLENGPVSTASVQSIRKGVTTESVTKSTSSSTTTTSIAKNMGNSCSYNVKQIPHENHQNNQQPQNQKLHDLYVPQVGIFAFFSLDKL